MRKQIILLFLLFTAFFFADAQQRPEPILVSKGKKYVFAGEKALPYVDNTYPPLKDTTDIITAGPGKDEKANSAADKTFFSSLTFLNAYNFDFYGKLNSNYVGMFNLYECAEKKWGVGINTGIMKINYGTGDLQKREYLLEENRKINPLDSVKPGVKYLRQYNKYLFTSSQSTWSFYVQPLLLLMSNEKLKIYGHAHGELFVNKVQTNMVLTTMQEDTAVIPASMPKNFVIGVKGDKEGASTNTSYNGYFGVGFSFDICLSEQKTSLFFQTTFGVTGEHNGVYPITNYVPTEERRKANGFYLVKACFSQHISNASRLVLAQDIRGLLPSYNPLYATYVGLSIKLEELVKLIKD